MWPYQLLVLRPHQTCDPGWQVLPLWLPSAPGAGGADCSSHALLWSRPWWSWRKAPVLRGHWGCFQNAEGLRKKLVEGIHHGIYSTYMYLQHPTTFYMAIGKMQFLSPNLACLDTAWIHKSWRHCLLEVMFSNAAMDLKHTVNVFEFEVPVAWQKHSKKIKNIHKLWSLSKWWQIHQIHWWYPNIDSNEVRFQEPELLPEENGDYCVGVMLDTDACRLPDWLS